MFINIPTSFSTECCASKTSIELEVSQIRLFALFNTFMTLYWAFVLFLRTWGKQVLVEFPHHFIRTLVFKELDHSLMTTPIDISILMVLKLADSVIVMSHLLFQTLEPLQFEINHTLLINLKCILCEDFVVKTVEEREYLCF